jgi:Ca2+-transporting ATPase
MNKPPRRPDETMFSEGTGMHILWVGLFMAFLTLGTQAWAIHAGDSHWQTMVFTVLSLSQLAHVLAIRSDREYILKRGFFSNPFLLGAIAVTFLLQLAVIYLPFANRVFKTQALTLSELALCVAVSALLFHAVEAEKWVRKRTRVRYS